MPTNPPDRGYAYTPPTTKSNPGRPKPTRSSPGSTNSNSWDFQTGGRWQGERNEMTTQAQNAGNQIMGSSPTDQWAGLTPAEYFAAAFGQGGINDGYGYTNRGGGGGGGTVRPTDPDPLGWNAIAQAQATEQGYQAMLAALDQKNAALMGGYDARNAALTGARDTGNAQLQALLDDLNARAGTAAQAVQGTYAQGDQTLANLTDQYAQMIAGRQAGMGNTLQAFGGSASDAVSNPAGVQDMLTAQRANLARVGQADQALLANRQNVYNGLNSDVTTQRQQAFDMLMSKLLAEKQATQAQAAAERAQMAMQMEQAKLQLAAQEQARKAQYV